MKIFEIFISLVTLIGGVNSAITGHAYVSFNEITEKFIQDSANNINGIFDYSGSEIIDNNSIENKYNQYKEDKKDFDLNEKERNSHYPEEEDEGYKVELNGEKLEIGDKNQIIRLVIPKNMGETNEPMLELEPVTDYEAEKEKSDTYGFLIGKNPLEKGDMYGDWHFNTVVLPGFIVKYPNFLNLSKKYFKVGISTLSFRSDDYEYGIMVNRYDVNGSSIKEIYDNFSKGASESELGDNWVYTYRNAADKDHFNYTVLDRGMTKDIIGSFPRQYKDIFDEVIEAGKQSLKICNEFPE
ncbi:hypothetical protein [Clostridium sp. B9]|uniref:hypothetical protein n=1 Tax=Clostridium sp. B9 TaxID=3423224 RepID=UPI003D2F2722